MRAPHLPRSLRARILVAVLVALGIALAGAVAGFNYLLRSRLNANATQLVRDRASARLATVSVHGGQITAPDTPDDAPLESRVWVFQGTRPVEAPHGAHRLGGIVESLAGGPARIRDAEPELRLAALPIKDHGRQVGTVVAALSLRPYEKTEQTALVASALFAGALFLLVGLGSAWALRSALRPVARMTSDAAAWSEHDLDRRFRLGDPYDELSQLAFTLDGLLDRLAASLRHERRFSAEMSHELRTPLATIIAEAELTLRRERTPESYREALARVLRSARQLSRTADTLLAAARQEAAVPAGTADVIACARRATEACAPLAAETRVAVTVDARAAALHAAVDADLLERILQPVLENAYRYGRRAATVSARMAIGSVLITVADDGPGIAADEHERIFEPAYRGAAGVGAAGGAGLGLALARRLARSGGGDVTAEPGQHGGRFVVRLPAAARSQSKGTPDLSSPQTFSG